MTGTEIAALIAAIAFAVLVGFLVKILMQLSKTMQKVDRTVQEANKTIAVVTQDVDVLSHQVEGLLAKSNVLLNDVNQKVGTIDPLFTAVADLSESVSDLNNAGQNLVHKVGNVGSDVKLPSKVSKLTTAGKVGGKAIKFVRNRHASQNQMPEIQEIKIK